MCYYSPSLSFESNQARSRKDLDFDSNAKVVETSNRGFLIGIEGIDAAGKRTQTSLLDEWLRSKGVRTHVLSFPDYTTSLGTEIRRFFTGERNYSAHVIHLLFAANRWEHRSDLVNWLSKGEVLVVNRYTESNLAYGMANGLKLSWLMSLEEGMPKSDQVILLDATPSTVRSRRKERNDRYENDLQLQQRTRDFYRELAEKFGWAVVDAGRSVDAVHGRVKKAITELFARHDQTI